MKQITMNSKKFFRKALMQLMALLLVAGSFSSCAEMHEPELHPMGNIVIDAPYPQLLDLDVIWEIDWRVNWKYYWDEESLGPIGYTQPSSFHMDYFKYVNSVRQYTGYDNFVGTRAHLSLTFGQHNLFFYNNDFENIHISNSTDWSVVTATTGVNQQAPHFRQSPPVRNMPDELFSDSIPAYISDNMKDYEWDDQVGAYVIHLYSELKPRVFIYLIQVELKNNRHRVVAGGDMVITGLSSSTNLYSGLTGQTSVAESFYSHFQEQILASGDTLALLGARMTTFGLCGIIPFEQKLKQTDNVPRADIRNDCIFNLHYSNGADSLVTVDISEQMRRKPTGGVINIVLDVNDYPMPINGGSSTTGGFDAVVDDWSGKDEHHMDI